jgi:hypothetical protein
MISIMALAHRTAEAIAASAPQSSEAIEQKAPTPT